MDRAVMQDMIDRAPFDNTQRLMYSEVLRGAIRDDGQVNPETCVMISLACDHKRHHQEFTDFVELTHTNDEIVKKDISNLKIGQKGLAVAIVISFIIAIIALIQSAAPKVQTFNAGGNIQDAGKTSTSIETNLQTNENQTP